MNQLQRLNGLKAYFETALQAGNTERTVLGLENVGVAPDRIPVWGRIVLHRGDPGDPQIDLSPVTYNYEHEIPLQITTIPDPDRGMSAAEIAVEILGIISAAILTDRTAGGVLDYLDGAAPSLDDIFTAGAQLTCDVEVTLVASYSTTSPL